MFIRLRAFHTVYKFRLSRTHAQTHTHKHARTHARKKHDDDMSAVVEDDDRGRLCAEATEATEATEDADDAEEQIDRNELSGEQRRAFQLAVEQRRALFITGLAGTGKTTLLRAILRTARARGSVLATATTARAACLLDHGSTLHRAVGLDADDNKSPVDRARALIDRCRSCCGAMLRAHSSAAAAAAARSASSASSTTVSCAWTELARKMRILAPLKHADACRLHALQTADLLVIDEISMLQPALFVAVDQMLRAARGQLDAPFGGLQVLLFGDFAQLPPVSAAAAAARAPRFQHANGAVDALDAALLLASELQQAPPVLPAVAHESIFAEALARAETKTFVFETDLFQQHFARVTLTHVFRQAGDPVWCALLGRARLAQCTAEDGRLLAARAVASAQVGIERCLQEHGVRPTLLFPRRKEVESINRRELTALTDPPVELLLQSAIKVRDRTFKSDDERARVEQRCQSMAAFAVSSSSQLEPELQLARGARVMCTYNVRVPTLYNGRMGTVLAIATFAVGADSGDAGGARKRARASASAETTTTKKLTATRVFTLPAHQVSSWTTASATATADGGSAHDFESWLRERGLRAHAPSAADRRADAPVRKWRVLDVRAAVVVALDADAGTPADCREVAVLLPLAQRRELGALGDATFHQFPLILAWAITVHKSQGATLNHAVVGCDTFETGQLYTALSRVPAARAIYLANYSGVRALRVHPLVAQSESAAAASSASSASVASVDAAGTVHDDGAAASCVK